MSNYKIKEMKINSELEVEKIVDAFLTNAVFNGWNIPQSEYSHVRDMCISLLYTKHDIGLPGGGFVQAMVENDLMGAYYRADSINEKHIKLYTELLYNY